MRIAVTYEDGQVFQHFGHTEQFKIYDVEDGKVVNAVVVPTNGSGHGALAGFLSQMKVNALICGGIGGGARAALDEAGILLYPGVAGQADAAAAALAAEFTARCAARTAAEGSPEPEGVDFEPLLWQLGAAICDNQQSTEKTTEEEKP